MLDRCDGRLLYGDGAFGDPQLAGDVGGVLHIGDATEEGIPTEVVELVRIERPAEDRAVGADLRARGGRSSSMMALTRSAEVPHASMRDATPRSLRSGPLRLPRGSP